MYHTPDHHWSMAIPLGLTPVTMIPARGALTVLRGREVDPQHRNRRCVIFLVYTCVFCTECLVILHALRARVIGVVIVVKLVKRSLNREATEIMNFFFFLLFIFFLTDAKPKPKIIQKQVRESKLFFWTEIKNQVGEDHNCKLRE